MPAVLDMQKRNIFLALIFIPCFIIRAVTLQAQPQMEMLNRGVVAVRAAEKQVFISWRLLGTEPVNTAFNIYRRQGAQQPVKLNGSPLTTATHFIDSVADLSVANTWLVKPILNGKELTTGAGEFILPANTPVQQYLSI